MAERFSFELLATCDAARTGIIHTAHGDIQTPAFMPVGTLGTVKAMMPEAVKETGAEVLLGNTYHLMLRPGAERVASFGGLHDFMNWQSPILTDSGGFQVMSLAKLRKISEAGVTFQSHIDGTTFELSPERSMEVQRLLGSDIVMVLDECTAHGATKADVERATLLSTRWADRSKTAFGDRQAHALFGIVQGGTHQDLREASVAGLLDIGFDGYAVGGLAVGEEQNDMFDVLDYTAPLLPADCPRYLMGVGKPVDIVGAVLRGIDMFDCVLPTRSGRTGQAFTARGTVNIRNARHMDDKRPVSEGCRCPACKSYSRGYLHHLFRAGEMLGPMLLTAHNLTYYQDLMISLREAIDGGACQVFAATFAADQEKGDIPIV